MTVARKLILAFVVFVALLVLTGGVGLYQIGQVGDIADRIGEQELPAVRYSGAMRAEVIDFRNRETQLLIIHSAAEIDETLGRQKKNAEALAQFESAYEQVAHRAEQKQLLGEYRKFLGDYMKTHEQLVIMVRAGEMDKALAYFRGEQRKVFRTLLPALEKIVEDSASNSDALRAESISIRRAARVEMLVAMLITAVVAFIMGGVLYASVVTPLARVRAAVMQIVASNDFTKPIPIEGKDEVSDTAAAVNQLTESVRNTLREFSVAIAQLTDMATHLASAAKQVECSAADQSEGASAMAATVEELTVSINQVADNANNLSSAAKTSDTAATEGGAVMVQTIEQMRSISSRIQETAVSIASLGQASNEITSIVQVIHEVAEQTNLLALNAAIEAARAGEQGRGFAVVADEVRKLAERTSLATQEISNKIDAIRSETELAGKQMGNCVEQVASGMSYADRANSAVSSIQSGFSTVDNEVAAISGALREQGLASNEIARRVESVAQASEENSRAAEETAELSRDLAVLATRLHESAARYTV